MIYLVLAAWFESFPLNQLLRLLIAIISQWSFPDSLSESNLTDKQYQLIWCQFCLYCPLSIVNPSLTYRQISVIMIPILLVLSIVQVLYFYLSSEILKVPLSWNTMQHCLILCIYQLSQKYFFDIEMCFFGEKWRRKGKDDFWQRFGKIHSRIFWRHLQKIQEKNQSYLDLHFPYLFNIK